MFFCGEEGLWSSFRGMREVIEAKGLCCSLHTDRASHHWLTPEAGGKVDKDRLTQFGAGSGSGALPGLRSDLRAREAGRGARLPAVGGDAAGPGGRADAVRAGAADAGYRAGPRRRSAGQGPRGAGQPDAAGPAGEGDAAAGDLRHGGGQRFPAGVHGGLQPALRGGAAQRLGRAPGGIARRPGTRPDPVRTACAQADEEPVDQFPGGASTR